MIYNFISKGKINNSYIKMHDIKHIADANR